MRYAVLAEFAENRDWSLFGYIPDPDPDPEDAEFPAGLYMLANKNTATKYSCLCGSRVIRYGSTPICSNAETLREINKSAC